MSITADNVDKLLVNSIEQYTVMLDHCDKLVNMLDDCDYSDINRLAVDLAEMQEKAYVHDEILLNLIKKDPEAWQGSVLLRNRQEIIRTMLEKNNKLLPRLKSVLAVARSERESFSASRAAVAGYNSINAVKKSVSRTA